MPDTYDQVNKPTCHLPTISGNGLGDRGDRRPIGISTELKLYERALRNDWPISFAQRQAAVILCVKLVNDVTADNRLRLRAVMVLSLLDNLNVKRERTQSEETQGNTRNAIEAMRLALQEQSSRESLNATSQALCNDGIVEAPQTQDGTITCDGQCSVDLKSLLDW